MKVPAWSVGFIIFIVALLIRLVGIGWGLPNARHNTSYHPDEPVIWLYAQQIDPLAGKFDPGFYNYGTLYLTALNLVGRTQGSIGGTDREADLQVVAAHHRAGRVISAWCGAGLAWTVFAFLRRRTHLVGAVAGGLLIAFAPALVVHSRFQTVDMMATFFLALSLYWAAEVLVRDSQKDIQHAAILAGLFAGLSAGTKYSGIIAIFALITALVIRSRSNPARLNFVQPGLVGVLVMLIAFVAGTPGALFNTAKFVQDFNYEIAHTNTGHGLVFVATPSGFVYHLGNLFETFGGLAVFIGAGGLIVASTRKHPWVWVLLAFGIIQYILIGRAEVKFLRYVFALAPLIAIGFGWLVGQTHQHVNPRWRLLVGFGILALGGVGGGGLATTMVMTRWMAAEDPRDEAARYLETKNAASVGLLSDPWFQTPSLSRDTALPRFPAYPFYPLEWTGRRAPEYRQNQFKDAREKVTVGNFALLPSLLTQSGENAPQYLVTSSFETDDLERIRAAGIDHPVQGEAESLARLGQPDSRYKVETIFGAGGPAVHDLMYIRPRITIWRHR